MESQGFLQPQSFANSKEGVTRLLSVHSKEKEMETQRLFGKGHQSVFLGLVPDHCEFPVERPALGGDCAASSGNSPESGALEGVQSRESHFLPGNWIMDPSL